LGVLIVNDVEERRERLEGDQYIFVWLVGRLVIAWPLKVGLRIKKVFWATPAIFNISDAKAKL